MTPGTENSEAAAENCVQACRFATLSLLPQPELRQLRKEQEKFVQGLVIALSQYFRLDVSLELGSLETVAYEKLAQSWETASLLTMFKMEPLRGVSVLEIPAQLGLAFVDRLMGGPGEAGESSREISEIEQALLEPAVQMLLDAWCAQWSGIKDLKPSMLGFETNGHFQQIATPDSTMLVLSLQTNFAGCGGCIQFCFPFASLEPLLAALKPNLEFQPAPADAAPTAAVACQWNNCFDEIPVPITAEWDGLEMTSRAVLDLKIGDFVQMNPQSARQVRVRLAGLPKFHGRPGTIAGQWAVELTQAIKS